MNNILTGIFSIINKSEKNKFKWLTVCNILVSLLDIASLAAILFIIHFCTQPAAQNTYSFLPAWFGNSHSVSLILAFLAFFLLKNIAAQYIFTLQYSFVYGVASRLSQANMRNYLEGNYANHVHIDSAVYIRSISQQPIEFAHYVLATVQQIITEAVLILFSVTAILLYNAKLFAITAVLLLPAAILLWYYTRKKMHTIRNNVNSNGAFALQHLKEALSAYVESNIYNRNDFFTERYANSQQTLNTQLAGLQTIQGLPSRMLEVFAVLGVCILVIAANITGSTGTDSFILLGAFMAAAYKIIPGLSKIINLSGQIKAYRFTIAELLQQKQDSTHTKTAEQCPPINSIAFNNISFSYNSRLLFNKLTLQIHHKDIVGIMAPSGSGKTTLINILLGLIKEDEGDIFINDQPRDITGRKKYWQRIAFIKQQNFLIHDTIEQNIVLGEKGYDKNKLENILSITGVNDVAAQYVEGLQKIITENGKNISGGQRQRIAIARALFKDVDLVILDEPFNELDNASETLLLQHFKQLAEEGKMIILITHQQASLAFCNKILDLNG